MAQMTNDLDDLSNIFNIDNFDLDSIPNLDGDFGEQLQHSQPGTHPGTPFDESMGGLGAPPGTVAQDFGHNGFTMPTSMGGQQHFMPLDAQAPVSMPYVSEPMYQPAMSQHYHQQQQQPFRYQPQYGFSGGHVPPTPNSFDMHGESGRFLQQQIDIQQRALMEQQKQLQQNGQLHQFTPLASPNGTPQYHVQPEFTVPGAYFSPLTSPALHAQNAGQMQPQFQRQHQQGYYTNPSTAPSSAAPSPIDPNGDIEMGGDSMTLPEPATQPKRPSRKKAATPRSLAMSKVKQSPIQKAQKRKSVALSNITTPKDAETMILDAQRSGRIVPASAGLRIPPAMESSGTDSVSPEPLTESLMGPPPKPGSTTQSPAICAQQGGATPSGKAATPKSLLSTKSLPQTASSASSTNGENGALDDLVLPAAANNEAPRRPPSLAQINTDLAPTSSAEQTPRVSARKTPKLGPSSTPASARPTSASASPATAFSPMTASTPAALLKDKRQDAKGARSNKKRGSVSTNASVMVSPALRPKISPSIKPLLPEGSKCMYSRQQWIHIANADAANLHSPQHALLLASKSNYQNLLEGNHLPGVSYPDSLSTGLTSKRTSHKVAEQGRRNRINEALKEMQALIPSSSGTKGNVEDHGEADSPEVGADGKETKESIAKSNSSKAATVESANKYIRQLKDMDAAQKAAMMALKRENDEMKQRLEELARVANGSSRGTPAVDPGPEDGGDAMDESRSPEAVEA